MSRFQETNEKIENAVVGAYQKIEESVVGGYRTVEKNVVSAYKRVEDGFVSTFLARDGETAQQAKLRITGQEDKE